MRPIFQGEGLKFLKGLTSRSFSQTKIAHTKVQKPVRVKACLYTSETLVTAPGCVQHVTRWKNQLSSQTSSSSRPINTTTVAPCSFLHPRSLLHFPKGSFSRLPHAGRFCIPDSQVFCSSCANILCTVFFGCASLALLFGCLLFVACMFLLKMQHQLLHACELVICLYSDLVVIHRQ